MSAFCLHTDERCFESLFRTAFKTYRVEHNTEASARLHVPYCGYKVVARERRRSKQQETREAFATVGGKTEDRQHCKPNHNQKPNQTEGRQQTRSIDSTHEHTTTPKDDQTKPCARYPVLPVNILGKRATTSNAVGFSNCTHARTVNSERVSARMKLKRTEKQISQKYVCTTAAREV